MFNLIIDRTSELCLTFDKNEKDLKTFFKYAYFWTIAGSEKLSNLNFVDFFEKELNESILKNPELKNINIEKEWFVYHLFILKELAKYYELEYLECTIDKIINNIEDIKLDYLICYVDLLNNSICDITGELLSARLKELARINEEMKEGRTGEQIYASNILDKYYEIVNFFKNYCNDREIFSKIYSLISKDDFDKYINKYEILAEIYLSIILINFDYLIIYSDDKEDVIEEKENMLYSNTFYFLKNTFKIDDDETNEITKKLIEIIKPSIVH